MLQKYFGERAGHGQYTNQTAHGARKGINSNIPARHSNSSAVPRTGPGARYLVAPASRRDFAIFPDRKIAGKMLAPRRSRIPPDSIVIRIKTRTAIRERRVRFSWKEAGARQIPRSGAAKDAPRYAARRRAPRANCRAGSALPCVAGSGYPRAPAQRRAPR